MLALGGSRRVSPRWRSGATVARGRQRRRGAQGSGAVGTRVRGDDSAIDADGRSIGGDAGTDIVVIDTSRGGEVATWQRVRLRQRSWWSAARRTSWPSTRT